MSTAISYPSILEQPLAPSAMLPQWFVTAQEDAWKQFQSLPIPKRGAEAWRFSTFNHLDFSAYQLVDTPVQAEEWIARSQGVKESAATLVFVNDQLVHADNHLPDGVICLPLVDALRECPDLVQSFFMRHPSTLGSAKYRALHAAHLSNGVFLHVADGVVVKHPLQIFN